MTERSLEPLARGVSKTPFAYVGNSLGLLREDQVPRFFGCLTDPAKLQTKRLKLADLTAMQNRVNTGKVNAMADGSASGKLPVVVRFSDRNWIADGHHRLTRMWLDGADEAEVYYKDLTDVTNAVKIDATITKVSEDQRIVYGWASVIEKDGSMVVDSQGDVITEGDLISAAHDFMLDARAAKAMHTGAHIGSVVESVVLTKDLQAALGIDLGKVGWLIAMKIESQEVWGAIKDGTFKSFSIGGRGQRVEL